ncbi:MAG: UDP-glucose/GDP-mannose dehydrogenase family protein [Deltaproteobacteria bacterium]|nr:UDP-glucose/GDP-mannose dehydrogenase family protein [Deltaproteobacteria bacterium]
MKVCVIGTGYVGLVAGAGFADMGNDVVCCDIDQSKIDTLKAGQLPIYEPGLEDLVARNVQERRLSFTTDVPAGVAGAEVIVLAVGTPPGPDGSADLQYIFKAAETAAKSLTGWAVVVTKSTVPVGTGDRIEALMREVATQPFAVASNPEFLKEGDAVSDFMKPSRVIIGSDDAKAIASLEALYAPFTRSRDRMLVMDRRSAELAKYAANSMLATRISFMNDLATLCDILGADIELVRKGMGSDDRIGPKFLYAGAGFGGSCFPKDLRACISTGREAGHHLRILEAVVEVNDTQKKRMGEKVLKHFKGNLKGKRVAVWGLAFKPGTDDIREAPAFVLIDQLLAAGAEVIVTDPVAMDASKKVLGTKVRFEVGNYECLQDADALVLATEWHQYRRPDFARIKSLMRTPVIVDGRNIWSPKELQTAGFAYYAIGRGTAADRA